MAILSCVSKECCKFVLHLSYSAPLFVNKTIWQTLTLCPLCQLEKLQLGKYSVHLVLDKFFALRGKSHATLLELTDSTEQIICTKNSLFISRPTSAEICGVPNWDKLYYVKIIVIWSAVLELSRANTGTRYTHNYWEQIFANQVRDKERHGQCIMDASPCKN